MELELSKRDLSTIQNYVAGKIISKGRMSPRQLEARLKEAISNLEDVVLFRENTSFYYECKKRLTAYKKIYMGLSMTIQWYKDEEKSSEMKSFYREL